MRFGKYLFISSLLGFVSAWAINATPFPIKSTQPDGSVVQIRKVGNEHFNYTVTDEDSVLVVRDSTGYWDYADEHGKKTGIRVHAKSKRRAKEKNFLKKRNSREILEKFRENRLKQLEKQRASEPQMLQSSSPMKANAWGGGTTKNTNTPTRPTFNSVKKEGDVRGLVVLVQFSDVTFKRDNAKEEYLDFLNKEGYSNYFMKGSARDFFILNSSGKYRPTFDVYGPITLKGKRDSYGTMVDPNNIAAGAVNAISEAMDSLVASNVDFTPYDSDGDRIVDFVYMIYAGVGSADTDVQTAIWPHSYNISKRLTRNMSMYRYACSPEIDGQAYMYRKSTDALNGIGTFCHEFSHVLGLQDHYDVGVNESRVRVRYTPGQWDLMDAGSYNCPQNKYMSTSCSPANLSAFERFSLGWLDPRRLEISDTTFVLKSIQENDGLVLTSKNDNEYYMVDFRLKNDFDGGLPNQGMLIWHINYDRYSWMYNEVNASDPMRVDLIEADGKADGYTVKDDAFPTSKGVNSFKGFVTWSGDSLGLEVYDIKIVDDHVEFKTRGSRVAPVLSSSSVAKSSSSSAKSSSSKAVSSSSKTVSSSSSKPASSSSVSSSSVTPSSSSVVMSSSSFAISSSSLVEWSSSSENVLIAERRYAASAVQFTVADRILKVNANMEGRKTVNLFDVNGSLLMRESFADKYCEIHMDALRGKSFVVVTLESGGQLVKTKKIRVK
jgi:M6 family metalloprotease-like protein